MGAGRVVPRPTPRLQLKQRPCLAVNRTAWRTLFQSAASLISFRAITAVLAAVQMGLKPGAWPFINCGGRRQEDLFLRLTALAAWLAVKRRRGSLGPSAGSLTHGRYAASEASKQDTRGFVRSLKLFSVLCRL